MGARDLSSNSPVEAGKRAHSIRCGPPANFDERATALLFRRMCADGWKVELQPDGSIVLRDANDRLNTLKAPAIIARMLRGVDDPAAYHVGDLRCDFTHVTIRGHGGTVQLEGMRGFDGTLPHDGRPIRFFVGSRLPGEPSPVVLETLAAVEVASHHGRFNAAVVARQPYYVGAIAREVTAERMARELQLETAGVQLLVRRFEMPGVHAFHFTFGKCRAITDLRCLRDAVLAMQIDSH